ncbi:MAG: sorbosone dehydrogenase family protein [Alphaproteobacteria bacterium]|nr:sorbosone dehydrogenase family protein [Alphaproteobacteria bacterium]
MTAPHLWLAAAALAIAACGEQAKLPIEAGQGPAPTLPAPNETLIPTVKIAEPVGWAAGEAPTPAQGLAVSMFAGGLDHPRWLHVLPNGDVLVAESNKPQRSGGGGLTGLVAGRIMKSAGAGVPSADRITLLRDRDGDGVPETRSVFLEKLHSPFGMALVGATFYVANADAILAFPYAEGALRLEGEGRKLADLPAGRNHHWTKNIHPSRDGTKLYATVGSNSNIGENGLDEEEGRAAIWEVDIASGEKRLFATGLRNPNGLAFEPATGALWTTVNERDMLGSDLVPDYMTSVVDGGFYGWPWSYFGDRVDERVKPLRPDMVAKALAPDYALGPHTASLGLAFAEGARLPGFASGAFVGQHGSWNRDPPSGYRVVFVPFTDGKPSGLPVDVLTGFLENGKARGRPVGVAVAADGALLVADDVGNAIWRVTAAN